VWSGNAWFAGVDAWDIYTRADVPVDAADRESNDNWTLVSSVTRAVSTQITGSSTETTTPNIGTAGRYVDYPFGSAVPVRALKFVVRDARELYYPNSGGSRTLLTTWAHVGVHTFRPYELTLFRVPTLPETDELGNPGMWVMRLFHYRAGNATGGSPLTRLVVNDESVPVTQTGALRLTVTGAVVTADPETGSIHLEITPESVAAAGLP
jgi:hypothetical protein